MWDCWASHNRRSLSTAQASASKPPPLLSGFRGGVAGGPGLAAGLSHTHTQAVSGPLWAWFSTSPPSRPSPWPRNSTHDSSSASCRYTFLSAKDFTSAKRLRRLPKVFPPCACTSAAYVIGRTPHDWPAWCAPVRPGVVQRRKERSALWHGGMRDVLRVWKCAEFAIWSSTWKAEQIKKTLASLKHATESIASSVPDCARLRNLSTFWALSHFILKLYEGFQVFTLLGWDPKGQTPPPKSYQRQITGALRLNPLGSFTAL